MGLRPLHLPLVLALAVLVWIPPATWAQDEAAPALRDRRPSEPPSPREPETDTQPQPWRLEQLAAAEERLDMRAFEVTVIRLEHISVESYVHTIEQLAEHPRLESMLGHIPMAINQEANAVVIVAAEETTRPLVKIADGLDQPNEYRRKRREQRAAADPWRRPARPRPHRSAHADPRDHRPVRAYEAPRDTEGPGATLAKLLRPDVAAGLQLSEEQLDGIRSAINEKRAALRRLNERVARARARAPHEQGRPPDHMEQRVRERRHQIQREARNAARSILTPEQRRQAMEILGEPPAGQAGAGTAPDEPAPPSHPAPGEESRQ